VKLAKALHLADVWRSLRPSIRSEAATAAIVLADELLRERGRPMIAEDIETTIVRKEKTK